MEYNDCSCGYPTVKFKCKIEIMQNRRIKS